MWSFAVLLWELVTREVPFADLSNMEIGMKVRWIPSYAPDFGKQEPNQTPLSLFSPLGGTRGTAAHHPAGHLPPHLQADEDLHERGPRQEAQI